MQTKQAQCMLFTHLYTLHKHVQQVESLLLLWYQEAHYSSFLAMTMVYQREISCIVSIRPFPNTSAPACRQNH